MGAPRRPHSCNRVPSQVQPLQRASGRFEGPRSNPESWALIMAGPCAYIQHYDEPGIPVDIRFRLAPPPPQLFDMDLERMHLDLYRSKYLTPDDFLTDIRKIVHNATVRVEEDPERLFRAQAMLTAAEVSIQDFEPQFRMECERMAVASWPYGNRENNAFVSVTHLC